MISSGNTSNFEKRVSKYGNTVAFISTVATILGLFATLFTNEIRLFVKNGHVYLSVLLILSALSAIYFAYAKKPRDFGLSFDLEQNLITAFPTREDPKLKEFISEKLQSSTEIFAIGIANYKLCEELTVDFYKQFLARGGVIKLMFLDPDGNEIKIRERKENRREGSLRHTVIHALENIDKFKHEANAMNISYSNKILHQLYNFQPSLNAVIIDKKYVVVHYYSETKRGSDVPTFLITETSHPALFNFYLEEMKQLWKN